MKVFYLGQGTSSTGKWNWNLLGCSSFISISGECVSIYFHLWAVHRIFSRRKEQHFPYRYVCTIDPPVSLVIFFLIFQSGCSNSRTLWHCTQVHFLFDKLVDDEVVNVSEKKVELVEIKLPTSPLHNGFKILIFMHMHFHELFFDTFKFIHNRVKDDQWKLLPNQSQFYSPTIYLHLIFDILLFEISSLMSFISSSWN